MFYEERSKGSILANSYLNLLNQETENMRSRTLFLVICAFIFVQVTAGVDRPTKNEQKQNFRVAVVRYQHETCTFCPGGDTTIQDWTRLRPLLKSKQVLRAGNYIRGFVKQSREFSDIELVGISSPYAVFGGSSRSWNSKASFEFFMNRIISDIKSQSPINGVYLALHGALAVRGIPRPEAEIARPRTTPMAWEVTVSCPMPVKSRSMS